MPFLHERVTLSSVHAELTLECSRISLANGLITTPVLDVHTTSRGKKHGTHDVGGKIDLWGRKHRVRGEPQ